MCLKFIMCDRRGKFSLTVAQHFAPPPSIAEEGLRRCLDLDPGDGRTYVVLGKLLSMDKRYDEARKLYTEGCQNTGMWYRARVAKTFRLHSRHCCWRIGLRKQRGAA